MTDRRRQAWGDIPAEFRVVDHYGARWVLVWDDTFGTCLARWVGP